ncbi:PCP reductase family protein [Synechococcus sp. PCC 7336]|uniref:PCP reductase family protein n=1 Tax=Synechococcus sp. PCC 7336 TaxID=195250 RepID=UPI000380ACB6|nr:PCP reductase family protein [Synechococcus sp. PCC 7336]
MSQLEWTPDAEARMKEVPFFVRRAARKKIEKFAVEEGVSTIDGEFCDRARAKFNANRR